MKRELFDIYETETDRPKMRWHAQMVNYVGQFANREQAEQFVASTKKARAQKSVATTK